MIELLMFEVEVKHLMEEEQDQPGYSIWIKILSVSMTVKVKLCIIYETKLSWLNH